MKSIVALLCVLLSSCALFSKGQIRTSRYFSLEPAPASRPPLRAPAGLELRIGRIVAAQHLREKMVYRVGDNELGYYDEKRWTERPESYLRRALLRTLFEERGLTAVVSGAAPTLEVELLSLEEVRAPRPVARIRLTFSLHDGRVTRLEDTITVERSIAPGVDNTRAMVSALSAALSAVVNDVAERVTKELIVMRAVEGAPSHTETR